MGGQTGNRRPPTAPRPPPFHTHTFGFTLVLHLLLSSTPLDPSRSVEIITVRLNSECFRFSLSLSLSPWRLPSILLSSVVWKASKRRSLSLPDEHEPTSVHVCLRLCQRWCVLYMCVSLMMDTVPFPCSWPPLAPPPPPPPPPLRGLEPNILLERSREGV